MRVEDGSFIVQQESVCASTGDELVPEARRSAPIKDNVLQADVS
jgi:hypothetical protein